MYTLAYSGHQAAVVINGSYIYKFKSKDDANKAVKSASEINVVFQPGNRNTLMDITPAVIQLLKIIPPTSFDIE